MYLNMYICIYIYEYIYAYMYTHTQISTYTDRNKPLPTTVFLFTMFPDQEPCVRDFTT